MKQELLNRLYSEVEFEKLTISEFLTLAHFYDVDINCYIETPIYTFNISDDICYNLDKLYKDMTNKNLYSSKLLYNELAYVFNDICVKVIFE
jgi:hypothetical protein